MGWTEFWSRYSRLLERREAAASSQAWSAALNRGSGHGMRQRGVHR